MEWEDCVWVRLMEWVEDGGKCMIEVMMGRW